MTARDLHDLHRAAALHIVRDWILAGCNSVALVSGRLEPCMSPPAAGTGGGRVWRNLAGFGRVASSRRPRACSCFRGRDGERNCGAADRRCPIGQKARRQPTGARRDKSSHFGSLAGSGHHLGTWDITDDRMLRVFVATVLAGQRYRGWGRAYRQAERAAR